LAPLKLPSSLQLLIVIPAKHSTLQTASLFAMLRIQETGSAFETKVRVERMIGRETDGTIICCAPSARKVIKIMKVGAQ